MDKSIFDMMEVWLYKVDMENIDIIRKWIEKHDCVFVVLSVEFYDNSDMKGICLCMIFHFDWRKLLGEIEE